MCIYMTCFGRKINCLEILMPLCIVGASRLFGREERLDAAAVTPVTARPETLLLDIASRKIFNDEFTLLVAQAL